VKPYCRRLVKDRANDNLQFIGGFQGDWQKAPSGQNVEKKLKLLSEEGVKFDTKGMLIDKSRWWDDFTI
jgi:methylated-DNA-[protein]-cysteine S-methyltransferase